MKVIFSPQQKLHDPQMMYVAGSIQPHSESPERAERLFAAAQRSGLTPVEPTDYGLEYIKAVHTPRYLHFFENIFTRWSRIEGASPEVMPGTQMLLGKTHYYHRCQTPRLPDEYKLIPQNSVPQYFEPDRSEN